MAAPSTDLSTIYEGIQIGAETTPGQRVAANVILYATGMELNPAGDVDEYRPDNAKYVQVTTNTRQWSEGSISGRQSYNDQLFLLYGILGKPQEVNQIATGVFDQIWTLRDRQKETPQTYTIEKGSSERAERATGCFFSGVTWNHSRSSVEVSGTIMGRAFESDVYLSGDEVQRIAVTASGGTYTATYSGQTTAAIPYNATAAALQAALVALSNVDPDEVEVYGDNVAGYTIFFRGDLGRSDVTALTLTTTSLTGGTATVTTVQAGNALLEILPKLVQPQNLDVYLVDTPTALGTISASDRISRIMSANVELTDKYAPVWTINSSLASFANVIETAPTFTVTVVIGKQDEGEKSAKKFQDRLRNSQYTYLRIAARGEKIGATAYNYESDMDFSVRPLMFANAAQDGVAAYSQPLRCVPSPEWNGRVARIRVRTGYNALPTA